MMGLETHLSIRDSIVQAKAVASHFNEDKRIEIAEALTHLIARQYDIPAGHPTLRVFTMIMGIRSVSDSQVALFCELRDLGGIQ